MGRVSHNVVRAGGGIAYHRIFVRISLANCWRRRTWIDAFSGCRHRCAGVPDLVVLRITGEDEMAGVGVRCAYRPRPDHGLVVESAVPIDHVCQLFAILRSVFCGTAQGVLPTEEIPTRGRGWTCPRR